jgi:hypothetical protein
MSYDFDNLKNFPEAPADVESAEQARDIAIQWQQWASEQSMSYGEVAAWQHYFENLTVKFPELTDEFKENAII